MKSPKQNDPEDKPPQIELPDANNYLLDVF